MLKINGLPTKRRIAGHKRNIYKQPCSKLYAALRFLLLEHSHISAAYLQFPSIDCNCVVTVYIWVFHECQHLLYLFLDSQSDIKIQDDPLFANVAIVQSNVSQFACMFSHTVEIPRYYLFFNHMLVYLWYDHRCSSRRGGSVRECWYQSDNHFYPGRLRAAPLATANIDKPRVGHGVQLLTLGRDMAN